MGTDVVLLGTLVRMGSVKVETDIETAIADGELKWSGKKLLRGGGVTKDLQKGWSSLRSLTILQFFYFF